ncbi:hypothetical protein GCM10009850_092750 [Nonomuraea monospora]|uniref:Uncharacterized protein n=1 Tax=Nonomuraea monospora TaxID=568818 RepID=A0ABN3CWD9_9ACTN
MDTGDDLYASAVILFTKAATAFACGEEEKVSPRVSADRSAGVAKAAAVSRLLRLLTSAR